MSSKDAINLELSTAVAVVESEIRSGFYDAHGNLRLSRSEIETWIGNRALDELRLAQMLGYILSNNQGRIPARFLCLIASQIADEASHFEMLTALLDQPERERVLSAAQHLCDQENIGEYWAEIRRCVDRGMVITALLEINLVHEGFSAAAIRVLSQLPFSDISTTYSLIGRDEERHHAEGMDFFAWCSSAARTEGFDPKSISSRMLDASAQGASMGWNWPPPPPPPAAIANLPSMH